MDLDLPDFEAWEVDPDEITFFEQVGSGCTAVVFRAQLNDEQVAVKQINWNRSDMHVKQQRAFDREIAIMPKVKHENLVRFIGVTSIKVFRIITEFCSGGCCFELLHNCDDIDLCWRQQWKMCVDVASAMDYLHKFNPRIIHRDLKSLNLLLARPVLSMDDVPCVKVSDFGLSRMKDQTRDDWGSMTTAAGTCHWMAPEVFQGPDYDEKVDVYSYSMILFEIICREIPFEDAEPASVGRLTVSGLRPDMEAVPPDCPPQLQDLMLACWSGDPKSRPAFDLILATLHGVKLR